MPFTMDLFCCLSKQSCPRKQQVFEIYSNSETISECPDVSFDSSVVASSDVFSPDVMTMAIARAMALAVAIAKPTAMAVHGLGNSHGAALPSGRCR